LERLSLYEWPGNVRELENVIRRAVAIGQYDQIRSEDLPPNFQHNLPVSMGGTSLSGTISDPSLAAYEKAAISNALGLSNGNRKKAAGILKIGEATLYRKLKKYNL
jgi:DNA-binding NtrC family response regulator